MMSERESSLSAALRRLVNGYQLSQAIHVAATLGVADLLRDGARTSDDLPAATETHADALYRLLRALASVGVFHEEAGRRFSLTALGECLVRRCAGAGRRVEARPYRDRRPSARRR